MVEVMKRMVTSFKRTQAHAVVLSAPAMQQATVNPHLHERLLDTHREVWLSLLLGHCSFLLAPGVQKAVCALEESVSPVLLKFCNQVPLAFKVKFPGCSESLCCLYRLGNLFSVLELSFQQEKFLGITQETTLHMDITRWTIPKSD